MPTIATPSSRLDRKYYVAFQIVSPKFLEPVKVPYPSESDLKEGQALVKFEAATVCGSDMPKWSGSEWKDYPGGVGLPLHECVGEVVMSKSHTLKKGARVLSMPINDCGLQEYFLTNDSQALVIDKELSSSAAALIQPLSTAIYAIERLGDVKTKTTLVIGLGSLGHLAAWLLKEKGAHVITADPVESVLDGDWKLGKHHAVMSNDLTETDLGTAPDIVVEVVGHQEQTIRLVRRRGTVLLMGVPRPGATLDLEAAFRKNVELISSVTPPWGEYFSKAYEMMKTHHTQLEKLVTDHVPFSEAPAAYERYANRASGRLKVAIVKDLAEQ
jgi:threonine dehydrogenase-like Zn-dependent dehydrogenase